MRVLQLWPLVNEIIRYLQSDSSSTSEHLTGHTWTHLGSCCSCSESSARHPKSWRRSRGAEGGGFRPSDLVSGHANTTHQTVLVVTSATLVVTGATLVVTGALLVVTKKLIETSATLVVTQQCIKQWSTTQQQHVQCLGLHNTATTPVSLSL